MGARRQRLRYIALLLVLCLVSQKKLKASGIWNSGQNKPFPRSCYHLGIRMSSSLTGKASQEEDPAVQRNSIVKQIDSDDDWQEFGTASIRVFSAFQEERKVLYKS